MPLLEVVAISKSYTPTVDAVKKVDLALDSGEILCLLGPSGCGKTTLLRLVAGLEAADSGVVRFDGRDMADVPPHLRDFGMMFQDFALFPHMKVRDNIAFGLRMHHMPPAAIESRVADMLDLIDMSAFAERDVNSLSGGEQQRIALARALAPNPRLLMLDEPLGALDRALRERLMIEVRAILKRIGVTAIYVTHDQTEAFAVGDRLAVMNAGIIEQVAPPREIYQEPASIVVANFLGYQNLIRGVVSADDTVETELGAFRPLGSLPPVGTPVTLLIKPSISEANLANGRMQEVNQICGMIDGTTFRGRFSQIWLATVGQRLLFETNGDTPDAIGESLCLHIAADQIRIYEPLDDIS